MNSDVAQDGNSDVAQAVNDAIAQAVKSALARAVNSADSDLAQAANSDVAQAVSDAVAKAVNDAIQRAVKNSAVARAPPNFTVKTFAAAENISEPMVWRLIQTGKLVAIKVGRLTRITPEARAAWKASLPVWKPGPPRIKQKKVVKAKKA